MRDQIIIKSRYNNCWFCRVVHIFLIISPPIRWKKYLSEWEIWSPPSSYRVWIFNTQAKSVTVRAPKRNGSYYRYGSIDSRFPSSLAWGIGAHRSEVGTFPEWTIATSTSKLMFAQWHGTRATHACAFRRRWWATGAAASREDPALGVDLKVKCNGQLDGPFFIRLP